MYGVVETVADELLPVANQVSGDGKSYAEVLPRKPRLGKVRSLQSR